jgi:hypothetical protein
MRQLKIGLVKWFELVSFQKQSTVLLFFDALHEQIRLQRRLRK